MSWQMISLDDVAPLPWRGGGGVTRELLAWPTPQDWDWRISVAELESSGPFSRFEGVERWFAVLGGAGVRLTADGQAHTLSAQGAPLCFDGAQDCVCELIDGACEGFNLMLRRGRSQARLLRVQGALDVAVHPGTRVAVYAWDEAVGVQVHRTFTTVPPHTLAWRAMPDGAAVRLEAPSALWMELGR
jgi:environmental stress-induced protein Ves